jgi:hypothetical protein
VVGDEGDVDIGLSDEEGLHSLSVIVLQIGLKGGSGPARYISTAYQMHSLKLFATVSSLRLEMGR